MKIKNTAVWNYRKLKNKSGKSTKACSGIKEQ
jgi:hypothetical protein